MKITTELAIKNIKQNKNIYTIISIMLATIITISTLILMASYQQYTVEVKRGERNYEAEFKNIKYSDAIEISKDENIKEISIIKNIGTSEEDFSQIEHLTEHINISEYDENAIKNNHIELLEGRMPKNKNEIVISNIGSNKEFTVGNNIDMTINGKRENYTIVGKAKKLANDDNGGMSFNATVGALIYLDMENLKNDDIVSITILTNNIFKIYETTEKWANIVYENEEQKNANLTYYDTLLNYSLVNTSNHAAQDTIKYSKDRTSEEFAANIKNILISVLVVITIFAYSAIYTSFKITYTKRTKELGMLEMQGMSKKQCQDMLLKEITIICIIAIIIGIVIGVFISILEIDAINILISKTTSISEDADERIIIDSNYKLKVQLNLLIIIITSLFVYIVTVLSAIVPIIKIYKKSPLEIVRQTEDKSLKNIKTCKIKNPEMELAYKNMKKEKTKYRAIVISISVSICLILVASMLIETYMSQISWYDIEGKNDYEIEVIGDNTEKSTEKIISYLQENNLADEYFRYNSVKAGNCTNLMIPLSMLSSNINNDLIEAYNGYCDISYDMYVIQGNLYNEILHNCGIERLEEGECILCDVTSQYGKVTNYDVGDIIVFGNIEKVNITNTENNVSEQEEINEILKDLGMENIQSDNVKDTSNLKEEQEYTLKIVGVNNLICEENILKPQINRLVILISEDTAKKWNQTLGNSYIYIKTNNAYEIDNHVNEIKNIALSDETIVTTNLYQEKVATESAKKIKEIVIYTFLVMISLFSIINTFHIITSNIMLRKKEFAMLKSIGMSNKQINKMLFYEGIVIIIEIILITFIINLCAFDAIYISIQGKGYNIPKVEWEQMAMAIIIAIIIIYFSINVGKNRVKNDEIMENIRN